MNSPISKAMHRYNHLCSEIDALYHSMSLRLGLSDSAMIVLYTLCSIGNSCPLQDIRRLSGLPKQTVNSAIRKLEAQGEISLEQATPKSKNICLTKAGEQLAGQTAKRIMQAENELFAAWPQEDVQKYLELTERFLRDLQKKAEQLQTES